MTTSDSDSDSDAIETLRDVVEDVASYDAREARTREGGDVEDSLVDAILESIDGRRRSSRGTSSTRAMDDSDAMCVKVPVRAIERLRLTHEDGDVGAIDALSRAATDSAARVVETMRDIVRDVLHAEDVLEREMRSRLGRRGANAVEEAMRERRSMDLMLVLNARARLREATRDDAAEAKDDDEDATAASSSVVESLRVKLVDAERAARESELVARSKVSKAFERVKACEDAARDAECAAEEGRARVDALTRELARVEAAREEACDALQAMNIKVSVLTAQVALEEPKTEANGATKTTPTSVDAATLDAMLATANEKLKKETEMLEASRRETRSLEEEVARLRPVAASADDLREDLSRAVAETNEARLNAENWKKLVDSKEHSSRTVIDRMKDDSDASEKKLRETVTRLEEEVRRSKEKCGALEIANEDVSRRSALMHQQAVEAGERVARNLRAKLDETMDELKELKRREAVHAAEGHAAAEATRRAAKFEEESRRAKHKLADAEMALRDSEEAVKALQFELEISGDRSHRDDESARRETRLRNELDESRALAKKSSADVERLTREVVQLGDALAAARDARDRLEKERDGLCERVDAAEKENEMNAILGDGVAPRDDSATLETTASAMDVLASENRRLESESKAARAALTTVEDTATTLRSAAARDREEFDAWKKRARELIDAKDREIDRLRGDGLANGVAAKKPAQIRHHSRAMSTARRHRGGDGDVDVDDASYVRSVVLEFFLAEEWEVQQNLLPTVVALCGGTSADVKKILEIRSQFEPTFVHSTEVAINKSLEHGATSVVEGANALTETLGLGKFF